MLFIICFAFYILSEQRLHLTYHGWMKLQRHVRCSSVQCCMTKKSYLIKNENFPGKKWCLAFNALFDVSNVAWPFLPVYTCKMFCFHRYDPRTLQICVNLIIPRLTRKKRWRSLYIFLQPQCMNVRYFEWTWLYAEI